VAAGDGRQRGVGDLPSPYHYKMETKKQIHAKKLKNQTQTKTTTYKKLRNKRKNLLPSKQTNNPKTKLKNQT